MNRPQPTYPATTLRTVYAACKPDESLSPDDPRCVDLTAARGGVNLMGRIAWTISATDPGTFHRQLITGHRGCGKSTEIKQLHALLRDSGLYAVYFDAAEVLDPGDIEYLDVLLGIAQALYNDIAKTELALDQELLESLSHWFAETILTREFHVDVEASLKAEVGVEAKIPALLRLFTNLTGLLKAGGSSRRTLRQTLERELRVFLTRLNELINDVQVKLAAAGWQGLVVLVDNLEKMSYRTLPTGESNYTTLFVHHADQLKAPNCHLVYTVPVSIVFNANLGADYDAIDVIPMVKLTDADGVTRCQEGFDALVNLVAHRVDIDRIFGSPEEVERLIGISGGVVRDLVRLIQFACADAAPRGLDRLDSAALDIGERRLAVEYEYRLLEEYIDRLAAFVQDRYLPLDDLSGRLLYDLLVLEYRNGESWYDLHPLVRKAPRLQRGLNRHPRAAVTGTDDQAQSPPGESGAV
jgi:hypothetical protein